MIGRNQISVLQRSKGQSAAQGFNVTTQENIVQRAGDSVTDNVMLKVASTSEQDWVTSAAPLLPTDNADLSIEVSTTQVQDLPLSLRNAVGLVLMNSSVNNQTQQKHLASRGQEDVAARVESFQSFGGWVLCSNGVLPDLSRKVLITWGGIMYVTPGIGHYANPFVPIQHRSLVFLESEGAGL